MKLSNTVLLVGWPTVGPPSGEGVPLDKSEGVVKSAPVPGGVVSTEWWPEGGGPGPWESHGESPFGGIVPPTIDAASRRGHDSSIRTPSEVGARAPNQSFGLSAVADDQGHPRAALGANDLGIGRLGAQHPVESDG